VEGSKIRRFVPDASVAVKWFIDEEYSDKARMLKDEFVGGTIDLLCPSLFLYEAVNAIRFHPIVKLSMKELSSAAIAIKQLGIMIEPSEGIWFKAVELSLIEGISIYDAIYLSSARTWEATMVTSDRKLLRNLSDSARKGVTLLEELKLS